MSGRPTNPVGRVIYDSMFLLALPVGLFVLKALYELLPVGVFLGVVLLPFVGLLLYNQYRSQADELRRRIRSSKADEFMAQLDNEASKGGSTTKRRKSSTGKASASANAGKGGSSSTSKKEDKGGGEAADDDDADEMLLRLAQSQINRGKKAR